MSSPRHQGGIGPVDPGRMVDRNQVRTAVPPDRHTQSCSVTALVVADDPHLSTLVPVALETVGFGVAVVDDAAAAVNLLCRRQVDLVVLDAHMPDTDVPSLWQRIRTTSRAPVLVLGASGHQETVTALEHGADAYLAGPVHPREVAMRAQDLVGGHHRSAGSTVRVGRLHIDSVQHVVWVAGGRVELSFTGFRLLAHLAAHRGEPQPWPGLLREVWHVREQRGGHELVRSAVYRLRSRLAASGDRTDYIVTVRGIGYLMPDLPPVPQ